jgi:hypothetical protein
MFLKSSVYILVSLDDWITEGIEMGFKHKD